MYKHKIKQILKKVIYANGTPSKLAMSFAVGQYVSFSPVPGGHTVIMLILQWLFKLNLPVLFFSSTFNNPWTAIPYFVTDYIFGFWLLRNVFGWKPQWTISLVKIFGSGEICLWSFFIGGTVLGLIAAAISYPIMLFVFRYIANYRVRKSQKDKVVLQEISVR